MQYTLSEIENGIAKVTWSDGSWTFIEMTSDMTEEDFDDAVFRAIPPNLKVGSTPAFITEGSVRTASEKSWDSSETDLPEWQIARQEAYGDISSQIEYITENGLDAWQTKVAQIKADNPKPAE